MNARAAAAEAVPELRAAGVPDAVFEAELLVRAASGISRTSFFAGADLSTAQQKRMMELVARRNAREPFAYIAGRREFYGLDFEVSPAVLIPRPETELLVEIALAAIHTSPGATVLDVGTGSGCVAVAIAHAVGDQGLPTPVFATDVSRAAIEVAKRNAEHFGSRVAFVRSDLASAVGRADVIVANLPYIPSAAIEALEPEVRAWEPHLALDGGENGLDHIRRLVLDCGHRLHPRLLALEVGEGQAQAVVALGQNVGARREVVRDLAGIERVVCFGWV